MLISLKIKVTDNKYILVERQQKENWQTNKKKSLLVSLFLADGGGRYTHPSRMVCFPLVRHAAMFSHELKERCLHKPTLGAGCWYSEGLVIERLGVRIPAGAAGELSSPELTLSLIHI